MSDPDDDDVLAAEFVLGTLDAQSRAEVELRLKNDGSLRQAVADWDDRLSPLVGLYADVPPPPHVLTRLLSQIDRSAAPDGYGHTSNVVELQKSVRRWRLATAITVAMAAALLGWIVVVPGSNHESRFVAVLQKDAASPAILLDVDIGARRAVIRQVAAEQPTDKSYELWLINPEIGPPKSLGVVQPQGITKASLRSYDAAVIARATYAITLEPLGGSSTGAPSGPPILTGKLISETP